MIWVDEECRISDGLIAAAWQPFGDSMWAADIRAGDYCLWASAPLPTEAAAKAAVSDWIDRTITQLSNAKVAGQNYVDDGA